MVDLDHDLGRQILQLDDRILAVARPAVEPARSGVYSTALFTDFVVEHIRGRNTSTAAPPLFVYWALHNTHAPLEAPPRFLRLYPQSATMRKKTRPVRPRANRAQAADWSSGSPVNSQRLA